MQIESRDEKTKDFKAISLTNGEIKIRGLNFDINEISILKNINMDISDGEKIGLVGNIPEVEKLHCLEI